MSSITHQFGGQDGSILVVRLPPAINHVTADPLRRDVERLLPNRDDAGLVLDAADVTLITSIGIAALLQIEDRCKSLGAPIVVVALTQPIRSMLGLLRLDTRFVEADTIEDAVASIERSLD